MTVAARVPVTVVCVFNNLAVRRDCLDRSLELLRDEAPDTEYLPVDNTSHAYPSAGAALNHGIRQARHPVVVLVHQDVALHSLVALERAAAELVTGGRFGVLGAVGVDGSGDVVGHVRDRVVLLGSAVATPVEVASLDEVLFMATKDLLLREPLTESTDMAWHAYAVEYGLRVRAQGLVPGVAAIPLTHNSLTVNLDRLDVAHRAVAAAHPDRVPLPTTCGVVTADGPVRRPPLLAGHRWRYRWLRGSWAAWAARRSAGPRPFVLADLRLDIDDAVRGRDGLRVVNVDPDGSFPDWPHGPLVLHRRTLPTTMSTATVAAARHVLADRARSTDPRDPLLVTNLSREALGALSADLPDGDHVVGLHPDYGHWVLVGISGLVPPAPWREPAAVPLGMTALPVPAVSR